MNLKKAGLLIFLILLVDQISKFYIKTHYALGDGVEVASWFRIVFVENPGMAWGKKLSDFISFVNEPQSKIILTTFRLFAIAGIFYWLNSSVKKNAPKILIISIALIFAGAFGNIIDSLFYNYIFDSGTIYNAEFDQWMDYGGVSQANFEGYSGFMQGCVVDMLQFPMVDTTLPDWFPFWGGRRFTFFDPVFNIADMAISTGVGILLVFNKRAFAKSIQPEEVVNE